MRSDLSLPALPSRPVMKLLSINNYHYLRGGAEAVYFAHDQLFRDSGWDTAFFSMRHPNNVPCKWSDYFVDEIELGKDYGVLEKAQMAGRVIYSLEARRKLGGLLQKFRPDVAHAHCIYHHISPSILPLLAERGVATVLTAHDLKLACPSYRMLNQTGICERCKGGNLLHVIRYRCIHGSLALSSLIALESAAHRALGIYRKHLRAIISPSRFLREKLIEWGWPAQLVQYVPNFIDIEAFAPKPLGEDFLYLGRLSPEKGVATLIRATALAGVKLRIAGTGPQREELESLALATGASVEFLGFQSGEALQSTIAQARAIVLPSEVYENAPISVLEAYASAKPVIGANIGGIPELIDEGETGFLFRSGDPDDLASSLAEAASLPADGLAAMGRAARERVQRNHSRELYREKMLALYSQL